MQLLAGILIVGLVVAVNYMLGGGRKRRQRPHPVPRPGTNGYRTDAGVDMLYYAAGDGNSMMGGQMPDQPRCDDPAADGDVGEDQGDCDPGADDSDSDTDTDDSGDSDSGGSDSPD